MAKRYANVCLRTKWMWVKVIFILQLKWNTQIKIQKEKKTQFTAQFLLFSFRRIFCHFHLLQRWKSIFIKMLHQMNWLLSCDPWETLLQIIKIIIFHSKWKWRLKTSTTIFKITGCDSLPVTMPLSFYAWIKTKCPFSKSTQLNANK